MRRADAGLAYLRGRGVRDDALGPAGVGWCDGDWLAPLARCHGWAEAELVELGLLDRRGRERLAGRVTIPEMASWTLCLVDRPPDRPRPGDRPKYLGVRAPRRALGLEAVAGRARVVIVEGAIDYLVGLGWGLPVLALGGLGLRPGELAALRRAREIALLLDADDAGRAEAARLAALIGARARVVAPPPPAKDLADLALLPDGRDRLLAALAGPRVIPPIVRRIAMHAPLTDDAVAAACLECALALVPDAWGFGWLEETLVVLLLTELEARPRLVVAVDDAVAGDLLRTAARLLSHAGHRAATRRRLFSAELIDWWARWEALDPACARWASPCRSSGCWPSGPRRRGDRLSDRRSPRPSGRGRVDDEPRRRHHPPACGTCWPRRPTRATRWRASTCARPCRPGRSRWRSPPSPAGCACWRAPGTRRRRRRWPPPSTPPSPRPASRPVAPDDDPARPGGRRARARPRSSWRCATRRSSRCAPTSATRPSARATRWRCWCARCRASARASGCCCA